ncbi:ADK-domain-containing protein [Cutaneotrichosporon oleaginosum]|uniref:GTP:AMP phosphotransferase, mitochondrial n=1 Tax=Cutaneotrichosporon oleaginosum TaxID=879819 RepID=A0A0J0XXH5_9TREE|nr:ADK-domain-containing protein [Cutaneotrichosporon oleaginosum]KLT45756.1 ADK-domain-containing protein [Cutaneotrichosporon oleaginosum]TXT04478.1 hypothetical protein COLE_07297 [Cutaneotrichosporon oleaginosum]
MRVPRSVFYATRAARPSQSAAAHRLASVLRLYSTATPVRDYEAQLRGVLDKAARNVEAGVRAPEGDDPRLRLIMVAKPGAGKGTLSSRLVKKYNLNFISTGDVLRHEIGAGSELGKQVEKIVAEGGLVPDELMVELVRKELDRHVDASWILDGFPRTLSQGRMLNEVLTSEGRPLNLIVNLNVPDSVILSRIQARWVHLPSGRVYNDDFNPPKTPGVDDETGEPLSKRPDDTPEVFIKRLRSYYEATAPLLEMYAAEYPDCLHSLTGNTSDEIWPQLMAVVAPLHERADAYAAEEDAHVREEADDMRDTTEVHVGDKTAHIR